MSARDGRALPYYPGSPLRERDVYAGTGAAPYPADQRGSGVRLPPLVVGMADGLTQVRRQLPADSPMTFCAWTASTASSGTIKSPAFST